MTSTSYLMDAFCDLKPENSTVIQLVQFTRTCRHRIADFQQNRCDESRQISNSSSSSLHSKIAVLTEAASKQSNCGVEFFCHHLAFTDNNAFVFSLVYTYRHVNNYL